jgi:hypothetical protein
MEQLQPLARTHRHGQGHRVNKGQLALVPTQHGVHPIGQLQIQVR